mgnify:CR=1 FL=1
MIFTQIKKITTIEELAMMVQAEFSGLKTGMDKRFDNVDKELHELKQEVYAIRLELDEVKRNLVNVAWHFEVEGLDRRLREVEGKLGIKRGE